MFVIQQHTKQIPASLQKLLFDWHTLHECMSFTVHNSGYISGHMHNVVACLEKTVSVDQRTLSDSYKCLMFHTHCVSKIQELKL